MLAKFEDDVSGVVKADGTLSLESRPVKGTWAVLQLIAQSVGLVSWTVLVNGSVVAIGKGSRASLGPFLLEPGDKVQLLAIGALPGANLTGHFVGSQSDIGWIELPIPPPIPNTITTEAIAPQSLLAEVKSIQTGMVATTGDLTIDQGTHAIAIGVSAIPPSSNTTFIQLSGTKSGIPIANIDVFDIGSSSGGGNWIVVPVPSGSERQIRYTINNNSGSVIALIQFVEILDPSAVWIWPFKLPVTIVGQTGTAAPWQAPANSISGVVNLAANGTAILINGNLSQRLYLFHITIYTDAAAAVEVRLIDGRTPTASIIGIGNVGTRGLVFSHDYHGAGPTTLNGGTAIQKNLLIWNPFGPAANFQYTLEYTQAA